MHTSTCTQFYKKNCKWMASTTSSCLCYVHFVCVRSFVHSLPFLIRQQEIEMTLNNLCLEENRTKCDEDNFHSISLHKTDEVDSSESGMFSFFFSISRNHINSHVRMHVFYTVVQCTSQHSKPFLGLWFHFYYNAIWHVILM